MKKNKLLLLCAFIFLLANTYGDVSINVEDEFYTDVSSWYVRGLIDSLPSLKPYPLNTIKDILSTVNEHGEVRDQKRVSYYIEQFFSSPISLSISNESTMILSNDKDEDDKNEKYDYNNKDFDYKDTMKVSLGGDVEFNPYYSLSYNALFYGGNETYNLLKPYYVQDSAFDYVADITTRMNFGSTKCYGTFGYNRLSHGLYSDDLILSSSSYPLLNTSFNYVNKRLRYSQVFGVMGASSYTNSHNYKWGKTLFFHELTFPLSKTLDCNFYESVVGGKYFQSAYFIPAPYFIICNVSGSTENVLTGLNLTWHPVPFICLTGDVLLDDFEPKKILKLKFEEASIRAGFKAGFLYSPSFSSVSLISFDYTAIMPYTYCKYNNLDEDYNYMDYRNGSVNQGSSMEPNKDKVTFKVAFRPVDKFKITTTTSFSRKGNVYENLSSSEVLEATEELSDKKISTIDQYDEIKDNTNFLNQDNVKYEFKACLDTDFYIKSTRRMEVAFNLGYEFEYIRNNGIERNIYSFNYAGTDDQKEQKIQEELEDWRKALYNSINNYFKVGVTIKY